MFDNAVEPDEISRMCMNLANLFNSKVIEIYRDIMQEKLALDREYIRHGPSIRKDLGIILRTFSAMLGLRN